MPVYRTYIARRRRSRGRPRSSATRDRRCARRRAGTSIDERALRLPRRGAAARSAAYIASERDDWLAFVMRWQQFTGPVMAKGRRGHGLLPLQPAGVAQRGRRRAGAGVGFDPVAELHARNARIAAQLAAHDDRHLDARHEAQRGRARAASTCCPRCPSEWAASGARAGRRMNAPLATTAMSRPRTTSMLLYQTLVGMWPLDDESRPSDGCATWRRRPARRRRTRAGSTPNAEYEAALQGFADGVLRARARSCDDVRALPAAASRSTARSTRSRRSCSKLTAPGVPDFYQGTELWDFSLVDPDNRRPVDYEKARRRSAQLSPHPRRCSNVADGPIKLFVTARTLATRTRHLDAFRGAYRAIDSTPPTPSPSPAAEDLLVVVPRLTTQLRSDAATPPRRGLGQLGRWRWGAGVTCSPRSRRRGTPRRNEVFAKFPVAILERA